MLVFTKAVFCWAAVWAFRSAMHAPGGLAALQPLTLAARALPTPQRAGKIIRPSLAKAYGSRSTRSVVLSQCSDVSTATVQRLPWPELQQWPWGCGVRQRKKITRRHTGAATQAIDTRTRVAHTLVTGWGLLKSFCVQFVCYLLQYIFSSI